MPLINPASETSVLRPATIALALIAMVGGLPGCATNPVENAPADQASVTHTAVMPAISDNATPGDTSPILNGQNPDGELSQATLNRWFNEAKEVVAREFNTDLSQVPATIVNSDQIAEQARSSLLVALHHDLSNDDFAEALVDNILAAQTASVLAIYSPEQRAILLHRENLHEYLKSQNTDIAPKASIQALLIHELVHAVDDIKHNAFNRKGASYQEVFAKSTIVEGHAQWQTRRLCQLSGCSSAFNSLNRYMFDVDTPDDPALKYVQTRNFKNLEFVYREGERFIDRLMHRPNGEDLIALAFARPPRDSIQIIDPDSFPNREREQRNLALSSTIVNAPKPWSDLEKGTLRRNVLAAAAFSVDPESRAPIVDFYTSKILAAAKHEYYDRASETPIPVAIIALETDDAATARKTAALIFDTTARTYNGLGGDLVRIDNWTTGRHYAQIPVDQQANKQMDDTRIEMYTASGDMVNGMVNDNYSIEVVTATSGQYIVHIDGRYKGKQELMQFAGQLLISLHNND